jgi:hypothetical protein
MDFCQSQKAMAWAFLLASCWLFQFAGSLSAASVTLAWDPSQGSAIAGYRLYQGGSSKAYTNVIEVGNSTSVTVSNLQIGATYYFAVSAYDSIGLESDLSSEISYSPRSPAARLNLSMSPGGAVLTGTGPVGSVYDLLSSGDLQQWIALGRLTIGSNGTAVFTDSANPPSSSSHRFYRLQLISP